MINNTGDLQQSIGPDIIRANRRRRNRMLGDISLKGSKDRRCGGDTLKTIQSKESGNDARGYSDIIERTD